MDDLPRQSARGLCSTIRLIDESDRLHRELRDALNSALGRVTETRGLLEAQRRELERLPAGLR